MFSKKIIKSAYFDTIKLSNFHFGTADAQSDEVLTFCFQKINGVTEFLNGTKSIVLGERGAGKSALFKLISENTIQFNTKRNNSRIDLIVPLNDDLDYISISQAIDTRFIGKSIKPHSKYRFLWELYILDRVIKRLEELKIEKNLEFLELKKDVERALGAANQKIGFFDAIKNSKFTTSTKYDSVTGSITPSFSVEPSANASSNGIEISDKEITQISKRLRKFIDKNTNYAVTVLIDKIDDFVVDIEYEEQLKNVQALVECANDYRFPEIKVKLFLRLDLFNRLNFERIGYDKIYSQTTTLEWSKEDICQFVARRLIYNFSENEIPIKLDIDLNALDLDLELRNQLINLAQSSDEVFLKRIKTFTDQLILKAKAQWAIINKTSHTARKTNLTQEISLTVISKIFPRKTNHLNIKCKKELLNIDDFFASHFKFGSDNPNPRLVLMFLNNVFELANRYYYNNTDLRILEPTSDNCYELILKDHIDEAYKNLQITGRKTVANFNTSWKRNIDQFFSNLGVPSKCSGLTINDIKEKAKFELDEDELRRFIAFFSHIGLFITENPNSPLESRKFEIPTLLRMCQQ